jgi:peptidase YpeB-like protein
MCTEHVLTEDQVRRVPDFVGRVLGYGAFDERWIDAGAVQADDIRGIKLGVQVNKEAPTPEYRLIYRVTVDRDGNIWTFIVDPASGTVLSVLQNFAT